MKAEQVKQLLATKYSAPAYAFLSQVRNGTGFEKNPRTCDGMAMSLFPSRGLELEGFEIKVARNDWKRELIMPEKADEFYGYCNRWWIVAGDAKVVDPAELPPGWGLLIATDKTLRIKVQAQRKKAKELDRTFIASLCRNLSLSMIPKDSIAAKIAEAKEFGKNDAYSEHIHKAHDFDRLSERVKKFEKASGIKIADHWKGGDEIGAAVAYVLSGDLGRARKDLKYARTHIVGILEGIDKGIKDLSSKTKLPENSGY